MRKVYFEVGEFVKYGDEDFVINGRKGQRSFKLANVVGETFWISYDFLLMYNIPVRDEDITGVTNDR